MYVLLPAKVRAAASPVDPGFSGGRLAIVYYTTISYITYIHTVMKTV